MRLIAKEAFINKESFLYQTITASAALSGKVVSPLVLLLLGFFQFLHLKFESTKFRSQFCRSNEYRRNKYILVVKSLYMYYIIIGKQLFALMDFVY